MDTVAKSPRTTQPHHSNKKISEYFSKYSYSPRSNHTGCYGNSKCNMVDGSCQTDLSGNQIEVKQNFNKAMITFVLQEFQSTWVAPDRVSDLQLTIGELKRQLTRTKVGVAALCTV